MPDTQNGPQEGSDGKWFKSQKFALTVGTIILSSLLLALSFVTDIVWKDVVMACFTVFMMGHVGEKWILKDENQDGVDDSTQDPEKVAREAAALRVQMTKEPGGLMVATATTTGPVPPGQTATVTAPVAVPTGTMTASTTTTIPVPAVAAILASPGIQASSATAATTITTTTKETTKVEEPPVNDGLGGSRE